MGLQSALSTALTGMTAAETTIDVVGNNVANSNTIGFKESSVNFATQFLQTLSIGSSPTNSLGGTNPRQIGLGVKVASVTPDFGQGTVELSSNPLDAAIQGDGFYIVEGPQGQQYYTRNGQFRTNPNNELVTITGQRVLGFGINDQYAIQPTNLVPLSIPLGGASVAQATQTVFLQGSLNPNGTIGTIPQIIESAVLIDGSKEAPPNTIVAESITRPAETTTLALSAAPGAIGAGSYRYRIVFEDADGYEGPASSVTAALTVGGGSGINLTNIPQPGVGSLFTNIKIYRNNTSSTDYRLAGTIPIGTTTFADATADAGLGPVLNASDLATSNYAYYVTYYNSSTGLESRPAARIGPVAAEASLKPRIRLDNIDKPSVDFDGIRIYRNLASEPTRFHRVTELTPAELATFASDVSFIDGASDASISAAPQVNLNGPGVNASLLLTDVMIREGANYVNLFETGTLSFTGTRGGRQMTAKNLAITGATTLNDLLDFMNSAVGIMETAPETSFPSASYGGSLVDSRLRFTSNMGVENAVDIDLAAFKLTPTGSTSPAPLPFTFTTVQEGNGEGTSADFLVYDSLGSALRVRISTVLESRSSTEARFRWIATSSDNAPLDGVQSFVGSGVLLTDGFGKFVSSTNDEIAIDRGSSPAASPLIFSLDFKEVTGLDSQERSELSASRQDGFPAGTLSSFIITETGRIQGVFSNGATRDLGQVRMARFANNAGLQQLGENLFAAGVNAGLPVEGNPGSQGLGAITAGAVELSNTDIGQNLIKLILASTQYRGGARVITSVQELLDELLALRR